MAKPTHMCIQYDTERNTVTAHYGKASLIKEHTPDPIFGGFIKEPFKHPEKGRVYFFRQVRDPDVYDTHTTPVHSIEKELRKEARKKGIQFVKADNVHSFQKLFYFKVEMGTAKTTKPPGGLYTTDLATCIGISIFNQETHYTHLFHTPGCDEEIMPDIINHLGSMLAQQNTRPDKIQVNIASGLITLGDDEVEEIIKKARDKLVEFFFSRDIDPKTHFAETRGEAYMFMSVNPHDGLVEAIKKCIAY